MTVPDWINGDPADLRRWRNARSEVLAPNLPDDVAITPFFPEAGCPGGLCFTPDVIKSDPVLYFHGGGFVVGSPETHQQNAAWIAYLVGAQVHSVRYRLAPEHPIPAQANDAVAAIRRRLRTTEKLKLMGDSAGGLVALWGYAGLSPAERRRIRDTVLFYPSSGPSIPPGPDDPALEADGLGPKSLESYFRRLDPMGLIPGNATLDPLTAEFPRPQNLVILAAANDPLLREAQALADRSDARLLVAVGLSHGFLNTLPTQPALDYLKQALGVEGAL